MSQSLQRGQIRLLGRVALRLDALGLSLQPRFAPELLRAGQFETVPLLRLGVGHHIGHGFFVGGGRGQLFALVLKHHAV